MAMPRIVALVAGVSASLAAPAAGTPSHMQAVRTIGPCSSPFNCVRIENVPVPTPGEGQALIRVNASSVNPSDVDSVEMGGCFLGCGADVAGTVVACPGCAQRKVGDEVWTLASHAYSEYVVAAEDMVVPKPKSLSMHEAGSIPEVGLTSYLSLKRTGSMPGTPMPLGSPWAQANFSNLTVVVTSGAGGTGFIGIELAKAWGAKHIATATTSPEGIAFVKSLGADIVVDYKTQDLFDSLPDNSVDIVYDNYAKEGTADKAMRTIRPGGMYLMMPHGQCFMGKIQGPPCISANPKAGVRQLNYVTGPDFHLYGQQGLQELADLFDAGLLSAHIDRMYSLADAAKAFEYSAGPGEGGVGHHFGKIGITMASESVASRAAQVRESEVLVV